MIQVEVKRHIAAEAKQIVNILLQHESLDQFFDASFILVQAEEEGQRPGGKGAVRRVSMGPVCFDEQIISADDAHIQYRIIGKAPVTQHQGDIQLTPNGKGCELTYKIRCKGPIWLPDFVLKKALQQGVDKAVKRLAEHVQ